MLLHPALYSSSSKNFFMPKKKISIPVSFEKEPKEKIEMLAYLFDRSGKLISKAAIKNNSIDTELDDTINLREVRLVIAPDIKRRDPDIDHIDQLEKNKPYEASLKIDTKGKITILPVPERLLILWVIKKRCRVRGRVTKRFMIDNIIEERPVCRARVHICEVDKIKLWIDRIPDLIITRIPDFIFEPIIPKDFPFPPVDPLGPIGPDPSPLDQLTAIKFIRPSFEVRSLDNIKLQREQNLPVIPQEVKQSLLTRNAKVIREAIVKHYALLHPYFCYHPFLWPYFYRCDEIKIVYTDNNGWFDDFITYWFWEEQPDLYFWVEYLINGVWTTVYKPNIPCHTWWNYVCGSSVFIKVKDVRVPWICETIIPGSIVWIKTLGQNASVSHIKQSAGAEVIQGIPFNNLALSDYAPGSQFAPGLYRRPFGASLTFRVQFGSGLPGGNFHYYRWSWRKVANADLSPVVSGFTTFTEEVRKTYTFEFVDIFGDTQIGSSSVKLGPVTVGANANLYHIPPVDPNMVPFSVPEASALWDQDTYSINFDSRVFSDGVYEFRMQLFNAAGALQVNYPKSIFKVPHFSTFSPSVNAPDALLYLNGAANADAFKILARIDNANCIAEIFKIKVKKLVAGIPTWVDASPDCCGFVEYNPAEAGQDVEVSFRAYHPNNLATMSFVMQKGTCVDTPVSAATNIPQVTAVDNMVIGNSNGYVRNAIGVYKKQFNHNQLLGICAGGGKAAFAESLYVATLSSNGTSRLDEEDDSSLAAFALEP
jgi:hypothetical protein